MYLAREKRSCSAIVRKMVSYEWDISHDGQSILQCISNAKTVAHNCKHSRQLNYQDVASKLAPLCSQLLHL